MGGSNNQIYEYTIQIMRRNILRRNKEYTRIAGSGK